MSVENFDGGGFADQPSIIYSFEKDDSDEVRICELARSGFGQASHSPGDVIEWETTKSNPTDSLPKLELPGEGGFVRDDCGKDIPAFACAADEGCGKPVYVGRTCANPTCERDWLAELGRSSRRQRNTRDYAAPSVLTTMGRKIIDYNHIFAAQSDRFAVDTPTPLYWTLFNVLLDQAEC